MVHSQLYSKCKKIFFVRLSGPLLPLGVFWTHEPPGYGPENESFSTAERSERVKKFLFAQRAKVPADQVRAGMRRPDRAMSALRGMQQTSKYITTLLSIASPIRGPFFRMNRALCCSACPPPPTPFFWPILGCLWNNVVVHSPVVLFAYSCLTLIYITFLMYSRAPPFLDLLFS